MKFTRFTQAEAAHASGLPASLPGWFEAEPSIVVQGVFADRLTTTLDTLRWPDRARLDPYACVGHMWRYALTHCKGAAAVEVDGEPSTFVELDEECIEAIAMLEAHELKRFLVAWPGGPTEFLCQAEFDSELDAACGGGRSLIGVRVIDLRELALDVASKLPRPLITLRPIHSGEIGRHQFSSRSIDVSST